MKLRRPLSRLIVLTGWLAGSCGPAAPALPSTSAVATRRLIGRSVSSAFHPRFQPRFVGRWP